MAMAGSISCSGRRGGEADGDAAEEENQKRGIEREQAALRVANHGDAAAERVRLQIRPTEYWA